MQDVFPTPTTSGVSSATTVLSAEGILQIAAIMATASPAACLPVPLRRTADDRGAGLYLAGPALVKAAIGQEATDRDPRHAKIHAEIGGAIDFLRAR